MELVLKLVIQVNYEVNGEFDVIKFLPDFSEHYSPWEPPCPLEELDLLGFMIDSGLKLSHEHHEPHWQNCSLEHFALISAN